MTNPHAAAGLLGSRISRQRAAERRNTRFEEIDWMIAGGSSPSEIADRIGATPRALSRQAHRWGRHDIGRLMDSADRGSCIDCATPISPESTRCPGCNNRNHIPRVRSAAA